MIFVEQDHPKTTRKDTSDFKFIRKLKFGELYRNPYTNIWYIKVKDDFHIAHAAGDADANSEMFDECSYTIMQRKLDALGS